MEKAARRACFQVNTEYVAETFCQCSSLTGSALGSSASSVRLGEGGCILPPPSSNFRTNRRGEERQAANEISQRGASNEVLKFYLKGGQRSGQYQVKY